MPAEFDQCVANGGRVRTKKVDKTHYQHLCFINGKSVAGEIKPYKKLKLARGKKS